MAFAGDRKKDLTICSICFETFKIPKYFPCLHSFCEECIQTYITTNFGQEEGGVNCPICRIFVSKPDDISVDEWSKELPTNHILVSLMDTNESEQSKIKCAACTRESETESACSWCRNCKEALCKTCDRCHRRNKATSNHELVKIGENLSTDKPTDVLCTEYPEKKVDMGSTDTNVDILTVVPKLTADINTVFVVTGVALLENSQVVISNKNNKTLELRDSQCSSVLSSLPLPGHPWGIKMTSDTDGAVAVQGHGLIIFNIKNNKIEQISEIKTNVNFDFVYHRDKYFVRCKRKIAVYDSCHHKLRDISVTSQEGYIAVLDDTSLCFAENKYGVSELSCMTVDGNLKFTYSHEELRHITGVTVDHTGYIYVCDFSSKSVHQLNHDGKLQRIMFQNLPASPYCISFNTRGNKAVIGCNRYIFLYDLG